MKSIYLGFKYHGNVYGAHYESSFPNKLNYIRDELLNIFNQPFQANFIDVFKSIDWKGVSEESSIVRSVVFSLKETQMIEGCLSIEELSNTIFSESKEDGIETVLIERGNYLSNEEVFLIDLDEQKMRTQLLLA